MRIKARNIQENAGCHVEVPTLNNEIQFKPLSPGNGSRESKKANLIVKETRKAATCEDRVKGLLWKDTG